MNKRLRNVKLSVYNPETRKWEVMNNVTVLLTKDFIYAINSEKFYDAVVKRFKETQFVSNLDNKATLNKKFNNCFNEMLDECPISKELQGVIYSGNISWKVELEENPLDIKNGFIINNIKL